MSYSRVVTVLIAASFVGSLLWAKEERKPSEWSCPIYPPEHKVITDSVTGNQVRFITTAPGSDRAFYFTHNAWLPDGSLIVFSTDRTGRSEYFGYLTATGELARLVPAGSANAGSAVVSRRGNYVYVIRDRSVYAWLVLVDAAGKNKVRIRERKIGDVPESLTVKEALTENADGAYLSLSANGKNGKNVIAAMEIETGAVKTLLETDIPTSHVQFSHTRPDLIMFAGDGAGDRNAQRMWLVDFSGKGAWKLHHQIPGELVTHECWWVNDLVTFCGGYLKDGYKVESHVKVVNIYTQETRIIGAGSYWPEGTTSEVAELNWWHACGDPIGRWVAADNWHGGIAIFDAQTTRMRLLTTGHRTYGHGTHPEVGWDTQGKAVIFGSEYFGNPDVCIAEIPEEWTKQ